MSFSEVKPSKPGADEKKGVRKGKKEEEQITKYRELLQSIQDKERKEKDKDMEMEVTWVPGTSAQQVELSTGGDGFYVGVLFYYFPHNRVKGECRKTGEEEDGGKRQHDSMGGVPGEKEGEEEGETERKEGEESIL